MSTMTHRDAATDRPQSSRNATNATSPKISPAWISYVAQNATQNIVQYIKFNWAKTEQAPHPGEHLRLVGYFALFSFGAGAIGPILRLYACGGLLGSEPQNAIQAKFVGFRTIKNAPSGALIVLWGYGLYNHTVFELLFYRIKLILHVVQLFALVFLGFS